MPDLKAMTANIIAGYVANAKVGADEIASLIASVSSVLDGLGKAEAVSEPMSSVTMLTPARIRKSVTDAGIVSFEDGKTYKSMKRSLARYGLTPDTYRAKWGLPKDYPMVAPAYSAARSAMAFKIGLGNKGRGAPVPAATPEPSPATAAPSKRKGRPPKAIARSNDTFT